MSSNIKNNILIVKINPIIKKKLNLNSVGFRTADQINFKTIEIIPLFNNLWFTRILAHIYSFVIMMEGTEIEAKFLRPT